MPTYQSQSDLVTINATLTATNPQSASFAVPMVAWQFNFGSWGADRIRTYAGTRTAVLAAWVADGGSVGDAVYRALDSMLKQQGAPSSVMVGRRDPGDADWGAALTAIYAADNSWYAFCLADERLAAGILEAATWASQRIVFFQGSTADADVYNDVAGNLSEDLANLTPTVADQAPRWALIWHDPQTASSAAAPFVEFVQPATGWDMRNAAAGQVTLNMSADGKAAEISTVAAARAVVTGTNTGTFAITDAWQLDLSFDGAGTVFSAIFDGETADIATANPGPWDLSTEAGNTVAGVSDTGSFSYALFSGVAPGDPTNVSAADLAADFVAAVAGTTATAVDSGGQVVTFSAITEGTDSRLRFTSSTSAGILSILGLTAEAEAAGSGNVQDLSAVTTDEVVTVVSAAIGASGTASNSSNALRLQGAIYGTLGAVTVEATSTAGLLTALGLTAATTAGTGDVPDASRVTALQLEPILDGDYSADVSVTVDVSTNTIRIESTLGVGYWHTLQFTSSMRSILGIATGIIRGAGVEDDHADAAAIGSRTVDIDANGLITWDYAPLVGVYGDDIPDPISVRLRRDQDVCTAEVRSTVPGAPVAELHDARTCGRLSSGEPVFIDARFGLDWLGVRLQEDLLAFLRGLAQNKTSVNYTDRDARPALLSVISRRLQIAAGLGIIEEADITPPNPATGKVTGVTIALKGELTTALRNIRHWSVTVTQQGAGKLHGVLVNLNIGNA